jgi:site-specific recombinase XerD
LSLEEIARLLEAAPGPKYKAALSAAYGAGWRVSEVVALKVSDIVQAASLRSAGIRNPQQFRTLLDVRVRSVMGSSKADIDQPS